MIGQLLDAAGQNCDLHFGRTGIRIMTMIIRYQFGLDFFRERHDVCFPFFRLCRSPCLQPKSHTLLRENREAGPVTWKNYTRKWATRLRRGCSQPAYARDQVLRAVSKDKHSIETIS